MCSPSIQLCLAALAVVFCLSSLTRADPIMSHEPVEHLKAHLPKTGDEISDKLDAFLRSSRQEVNRKTAQMEKNLKKVLKKEAHVSAILLKETTILAKRFPPGLQFNSTLLLPFGVLLPILSTTLPILLENYRPELLHNAVGNVLKGKDRDHSDVKDFLSLSLLDLVTKLPQNGGAPSLTDPGLLLELNRRGKAAVYCVNTILENIAEDAWKDALMAVAMDYSAFSENHQMLTHFKDLGMYAETTASDLVNFFEASQSDAYPLDAGHYLFGWWFNCPRGSGSNRDTGCMAPFLPRDSVAVLNPAIRIYSVPRLRLHLIIGNTGDSSGIRSVADVLREDRPIWKAIYSVVDPASVQEETKEPDTEKDTKTEDAAPEPKEKRETEKDTSVGEEEAPSKPLPKEAEPEKIPPEQEPKAEKVEEKEEKPTSAPAAEQAEEQIPDKSAKEDKEDEVVGESTQDAETAASNSQPTRSEKSPSQKPSAADTMEEEEDQVVGGNGEEGEGEEEEEGEVSRLTRAIHVGWPIAVFTFYTIFSHVWVYWFMHLLWFLLSSVFSNIYLPRPKTAKQD